MQGRIMCYVTVSCELMRDLDQKVNKKIQEGWQPYGSPYNFIETIWEKKLDKKMTKTYCSQPMVRYEKIKRR